MHPKYRPLPLSVASCYVIQRLHFFLSPVSFPSVLPGQPLPSFLPVQQTRLHFLGFSIKGSTLSLTSFSCLNDLEIHPYCVFSKQCIFISFMCMCAGRCVGHACYSPCVNIVRLRVNDSLHHMTPKDETQVINLGGILKRLIKSGLFIIGQFSAIRQTEAPLSACYRGAPGLFPVPDSHEQSCTTFKVRLCVGIHFYFLTETHSSGSASRSQ